MNPVAPVTNTRIASLHEIRSPATGVAPRDILVK